MNRAVKIAFNAGKAFGVESLCDAMNYKTIVQAGVRATAAVLALVVQILLVRYVGEHDYGVYVLYTTLCGLLVVLAKFGLDTIMVKRSAILFERGFHRGLRSLLWRATTYSLVCTVSIVVVLFAILNLPSAHKLSKSFDWRFWWILAGVGASSACAIFLGALKGARRPVAADIAETLVKPLAVLATVVCALYSVGVSTSITYLAFILSNLASIALVWFFLDRTLVRRGVEEFHSAVGGIIAGRDAAIFILSGLINFGFFQLDTLLVGVMLGNELAGAYAMACNYVRLVIFVPLIVVVQLQPKVAVSYSRGDGVAVRSATVAALRLGLLSSVAAAIALGILGPWLLRLSSPDFVEARWALILLSCVHIFNGVSLILIGAMHMCGRQKDVLVAQVFGLAVCLPILPWAIRNWGMEGAAVAVLLGIVATLLSQLMALHKKELGA